MLCSPTLARMDVNRWLEKVEKTSLGVRWFCHRVEEMWVAISWVLSVQDSVSVGKICEVREEGA